MFESNSVTSDERERRRCHEWPPTIDTAGLDDPLKVLDNGNLELANIASRYLARQGSDHIVSMRGLII